MPNTEKHEGKSEDQATRIMQAFQAAGYRARIEPATGQSASKVILDLDEGRRSRQAQILVENNGNSSLRLSRPYDAVLDESSEPAWVTVLGNNAPDIEGRLVESLRVALIRNRPEDPDASVEDMRRALEPVADRRRNTSSMGNPRGSDIAILANVVLRLLDRIETLEKQFGGPGS